MRVRTVVTSRGQPVVFDDDGMLVRSVSLVGGALEVVRSCEQIVANGEILPGLAIKEVYAAEGDRIVLRKTVLGRYLTLGEIQFDE